MRDFDIFSELLDRAEDMEEETLKVARRVWRQDMRIGVELLGCLHGSSCMTLEYEVPEGGENG